MAAAKGGDGWGPAAGMVLVQLFITGLVLITKIVIDRGTFIFALLAYRAAVGSLAVLPFALFLERGQWRKLTWRPFFWIFMAGLLGFTVPIGAYYYGLADTTPGYSINFLNVVPVVTFILAAIFRIEKIGLGRVSGGMKIGGTVLCVGGALLISLYRGKELHLWPAISIPGFHPAVNKVTSKHHLRGTVLLVITCTSLGSWYLVQSKMLSAFPFKFLATAVTLACASLQCAVAGVVVNRNIAAWKLARKLQLITIFYSGILTSGVKFCIIAWVVTQKGPTYPSMFSSLSVIFTTILDSMFMGHNITVGSLIGMTMIIAGLYTFLSGQRKELSSSTEKVEEEEEGGDTSTAQLPTTNAPGT